MYKIPVEEDPYIQKFVMDQCKTPEMGETLHKMEMKFSIKDFFSKCDQIHWSRLLKKSLIENFIFLGSERAGEEDLYTLEDEKKRDKKVVE